MAWLARLRFRVVRLEEAVQGLLAGGPPPPRAVAITFDDGTRDLRTLALPVLQRHCFPATAFVVTSAMGSAVSWTEQPGLAGRPVMSWNDALELEPLVSLQPHTRTHPSLPTLGKDALDTELRASREDVQRHSGRSAVLFAYPYGDYDMRVTAAVSRTGYVAACTVRSGLNTHLTPAYELRRYELRGDAPPMSLARIFLTRPKRDRGVK
jgi:peptidoglycan/xylan/chitin deacetylase (PgdA/CDA1 family)